MAVIPSVNAEEFLKVCEKVCLDQEIIVLIGTETWQVFLVCL